MKIYLKIEDKNPKAKILLTYLKSLSKTENYISFFDIGSEKKEDTILLYEMIKAKKTGMADKNTVLIEPFPSSLPDNLPPGVEDRKKEEATEPHDNNSICFPM